MCSVAVGIMPDCPQNQPYDICIMFTQTWQHPLKVFQSQDYDFSVGDPFFVQMILVIQITATPGTIHTLQLFPFILYSEFPIQLCLLRIARYKGHHYKLLLQQVYWVFSNYDSLQLACNSLTNPTFKSLVSVTNQVAIHKTT